MRGLIPGSLVCSTDSFTLDHQLVTYSPHNKINVPAHYAKPVLIKLLFSLIFIRFSHRATFVCLFVWLFVYFFIHLFIYFVSYLFISLFFLPVPAIIHTEKHSNGKENQLSTSYPILLTRNQQWSVLKQRCWWFPLYMQYFRGCCFWNFIMQCFLGCWFWKFIMHNYNKGKKSLDSFPDYQFPNFEGGGFYLASKCMFKVKTKTLD